jgi:hypothetical protein
MILLNSPSQVARITGTWKKWFLELGSTPGKDAMNIVEMRNGAIEIDMRPASQRIATC